MEVPRSERVQGGRGVARIAGGRNRARATRGRGVGLRKIDALGG